MPSAHACVVYRNYLSIINEKASEWILFAYVSAMPAATAREAGSRCCRRLNVVAAASVSRMKKKAVFLPIAVLCPFTNIESSLVLDTFA